MSDPTPPTGPGQDERHAGPVVARLARLVAIGGGMVVVVVAFAVTASVLLRWTAGSGIDGDFELVQIGTAVAAFAFLPYCQARRGNIVVDSLTGGLPARWRAGLDALWDLVLAGLAGLIAWRLVVGAGEAVTTGTTSMVLGLPIGPAVATVAVLAGFLALVATATALRALKGAR